MVLLSAGSFSRQSVVHGTLLNVHLIVKLGAQRLMGLLCSLHFHLTAHAAAFSSTYIE